MVASMASSLTVDSDPVPGEARVPQRPVAPRRRKVRERVSLGHLFMIAAALLAFVLVVSVLQDRTLTTKVVVANTEILPGAEITPDLVSEVEIPADSDLVGAVATMSMIAAGDVSAGQRLSVGDPITMTALTPDSSPSGLRAMSLPIDRVDAVGGDIRPGDRVDVIAVVSSTASYVAVDLEVLDTQSSEARTGALSSSSLSTYFVTVSIDDATALELALALDIGTVRVLRSTGAEPIPPGEREITAVPARGARALDEAANDG